MTKIVHEFCGICIQRRDIAGCFSGVWGGGLRFGEESCLCGSSYTLGMLHLFCIARHSLLVVGRVAGSNHSPPVRRRGVQRNSLSPRQVPPAAVALRNAPAGAALGAPAAFCIALCAIARHSLLVVGQGCGLQPFAACSAAGRTEEQPRSALRLFFASRFARLRGIAAQAKKTAAVKGNGCRAPCSLSGFLHHKTPYGKYLRKKYHTMVLPVTQV